MFDDISLPLHSTRNIAPCVAIAATLTIVSVDHERGVAAVAAAGYRPGDRRWRWGLVDDDTNLLSKSI